MDAGQDGGTMLMAPVVDRMFVEAEQLLLAAREAAKTSPGRGVAGVKGQIEALRVTARLSQIVAWLLAARALSKGEISTAEMIHDHGLDDDARAVCLTEAAAGSDLSPALRALTASSLALYRRVARLDTLLAERPPLPSGTAADEILHGLSRF